VDADDWLIDELTALAVPLAAHAGELLLAQSGRRLTVTSSPAPTWSTVPTWPPSGF